MYQALYRKWRPKSFDEVVGQEHITEILKKQVLLDRLSHAYLFTGTRGTGKTSCAKILAKAVNCENPVGGNPCGKCAACTGIDNGSILDVTEMDAASNNGVENVRALREEAVYTPAAVKRRVYIIDEVHMLSNSAFNALLKILEEPPEHLIFILATTELHKVPATILSRCQRYSFRRLPVQVICGRLAQIARAEGMELTDEAAAMLAHLADGSVRDALSLLDQCAGQRIDKERVISAIGMADNDMICDMLSAILNGDAESALDILDKLYRGGKDVAAVLGQLAALHRDILLSEIAPKGGPGLMSGSFTEENLAAAGRAADRSRLLGGLEAILDTLTQLSKSSDRRLCSELCLIKLCGMRAAPAYVAAGVGEEVRQAVPKPAAAPARSVQKEPEPVPQPEIIAKPEPAPQAKISAKPDEKAGRDIWQRILTELEKRLAVFNYMLIADSAHAEGSVADSTVTVHAKSEFSLSQLDTPEIIDQVKAAASGIIGGPVKVRIELFEDKDVGKFDKLDSFISQFGIKEEN